MRAKTLLGWLALTGVCATGAITSAQRIESDLAARSARAMDRAGLPPSAIRAEGRDLVLLSSALAAADRARARVMLGTIDGVRRVLVREDR